MRRIWVVALVVACKHGPVVDITTVEPTLDVLGFEPPFEEVPVAKAFVAAHHVKSIAVHEVEPGTTTVRASVMTVYNADGAPVQVFERGAGHDFELDLVATTAYVRDAAALPAAVSPNDRVVLVDPSGRTLRVVTPHADETWSYDASGHVVRVAREADGKHFEELRTYDTTGHLAKRTRGEVGAPPFETIEVAYDHGRVTELRGAKPGYSDDRYRFRYDTAGQLAELAFVESGKDIYQRAYTYDRDGYLTRIEQHASVPAMGSATFVIEYALPEGKRTATPVVFPGPPPQKTDAELVGAIGTVFHVVPGTAVVTWDRGDPKKPFLVTVAFDVAVDAAGLTEVELAAKACALRQALGFQCDCEKLERGPAHAGAVTLTFQLNLRC